MKKLSCILLAAMLITAMFVSCTAEVIDPYDGLAYVTFGGPASKDLSASYEVQSYEKLYWFYTAKKADKFGMTGVTSEETALATENNAPAKGLGGTIGPFSQGDWEFGLYAYSSLKNGKGDGLVYSGTTSVKGLAGNSSSNPKGVPVSVTPQGKYGTIEFRNAYFKWNEDKGGNAKPTIKITAEGPQTYTLLSGLENFDENGNVPLKWKDGTLSIDQSYNVPAGYYKCTVVAWVVDESSPIFEQSFGIGVYGSATTVISGDITEKVDSFVDFEAKSDLNIFQGTDSVIFASTPSNVPGLVTTVDFKGLDTSIQYSLNIAVSDAASASGKFNVEDDNKTAVAAIDFQLKQVGSENAVSFSEATVTTYITTGLESVEVRYNGEGAATTYAEYDSETGRLVFKTSHFSEYYVVADKVANVGGKGYGSLQDAIDAAQDDDVIVLQKDIQWTEKIEISGKRKLTIDLNGFSVVGNDGDKGYLFDIYDAEVLFTGKGVISDTAVWGYAPIGVRGSSEDCQNYTVVTIDSEVVIKGFYGIMISADVKGGKSFHNYGLVVNVKGTIEVPIETCPVEKYPEYGGAAIYVHGSNTITKGNVISINLEDATINVDKGEGIYAAGYAKWNIKNTKINGVDTAIEIRAGELNIGSGKFTASAIPTAVTPNGNGSTSSGAAIAVAQHTSKLPVIVNISGGTFEGYSAFYESNSENNDKESISKVDLGITGGTFNAINGGSVAVYSQDCKKFIADGAFSSEPSDEYLATGYISVKDSDTGLWNVVEGYNNLCDFYAAKNSCDVTEFPLNPSSNATSDFEIDGGGYGEKTLIKEWQDLWAYGNVTVKNFVFLDGAVISAGSYDNETTITVEDCIFHGTNQIELFEKATREGSAGSNTITGSPTFKSSSNSRNEMGLIIRTNNGQGDANADKLVTVVIRGCSFIGKNDGTSSRKTGHQSYKLWYGGTAANKGGFGLGIGSVEGNSYRMKSALVEGCTFEGINGHALHIDTFNCDITVRNNIFKSYGINRENLAASADEPEDVAFRGAMVAGSSATVTLSGNQYLSGHDNVKVKINNCDVNAE